MDTATVGLGRFIKEGRFVVPSHQRDYSWTSEYVKVFIENIEEAMEQGRDLYFCGLMVFTGSAASSYKVLDGQQRLATTLMIFSAVRNWFTRYSDFNDWRDQARDYLGSRELGSQTTEPRLSLTAANNDAFIQFVIDARPVEEMTRAKRQRMVSDRNSTLLDAAIWMNRYIERRAEAFGSPEVAKDRFLNLLRYISDTVRIVPFVLHSDAAAYTVFETLNDRGLDLAPLDLVKNYLFAHAEKHRLNSLPEFEERWTEIMALLGSSRADSFLRAFWVSQNGKPKGTKLFSSFKHKYDTPEKIYRASLDMRRDAERYAALFSSSDPIWSEYPDKTRRSVDALSTIGFSQAYPIILAALGRFDRREMERLVWLVECLAVRHQLIGQRRPGRVEDLGGRAAKDIYDGGLKSATDVFNAVRELYVPDSEFQVAFKSVTETSGKKIRYLISGIERESVARENGSLSNELEPHNVTVEHIFPRSPDSYWRSISASDGAWDDTLKARLGNLCLLPGINQSLGNKEWPEKLKVYERSRLRTTNKLTQFSAWGRTEIITRQTWMAELAVAAWRFQ